MNIKLTYDHINKGIRCSCLTCPVALALSTKFLSVYVVRLVSTLNGELYDHSPELIEYIHKFDLKSRVHPVTLVVNEETHEISIA